MAPASDPRQKLLQALQSFAGKLSGSHAKLAESMHRLSELLGKASQREFVAQGVQLPKTANPL
jgi:hypothetical protein